MDVKHIIEPERQGLWIAATFILALLALVLAFLGYQRATQITYLTQAEVLLLNKKIENVAKGTPAQAPEAAGQEQQ